MIKKINNKNEEIASKILEIFQASYIIEAKLLNVVNFPPLNRTIKQFINSNNDFYAHFLDGCITGVIEIVDFKDSIHIQSLVVYPKNFRKGIGSSLVEFVLGRYNSMQFTVETGIDNYPAINLYKSFGFEKQRQFNTNHGVIKGSYKRTI